MENINFPQKPSQGSLRASNPVQNQRKGVGLPYFSFKNRSIGWGSEDRNELNPRFVYNDIHMKTRLENLQGDGVGIKLDAFQVGIKLDAFQVCSQ